MATIALSRPLPPHRSSSTALDPISAISLESIAPAHAAVPNKHIPICPAGSAPSESEDTKTPLSPFPSEQDEQESLPGSLLYPPHGLSHISSGPLKLFEVGAADVAAAIDHISRQPLPDPSLVFPWFHGLHPQNHIQQAFFIARRRALRRTPSCFRGVTVVKADGNLTQSRLKGAIAPQEFLATDVEPEFIDVDPKDGFCVRNFQIQAAKSAMVSDIIIYGDDPVVVRKLAWDTAAAQLRWREKHQTQCHSLPEYNTFICVDPFDLFEENHAEVVAIDSTGRLTGNVIDFLHQERKEMYALTEASEITENVWLGPTPDPSAPDDGQFDILIECSDVGRLNPATLKSIAKSSEEPSERPFIDFPSSGSILPPSWSQAEADGILETCKWIYHLAHGTLPADEEDTSVDQNGDFSMREESEESDASGSSRPRRILIHCADGYTESTMLGIAYFSYSTGRGVADAWLHLHTEKGRNFFAYPTDVALLTCIEPRLLQESPLHAGKSIPEITELIHEPAWLAGLDGSFPSRVVDYMYLGNLGHANNPDLLKALGIRQILSVGEMPMWREGEMEDWGPDNIYAIQGVQDNGIDPLTYEFERCLEFIGEFALRESSVDKRPLLMIGIRTRPAERHRDVGSLPCGRVAKCYHMHRRGHEVDEHVLPRRLLLRPCSATQRHHPAPFALRVRAPEVGGSSASQRARALRHEKGIGMGRDCPRNCSSEPTIRQIIRHSRLPPHSEGGIHKPMEWRSWRVQLRDRVNLAAQNLPLCMAGLLQVLSSASD